ncbi:unnamed protein product, partial [Ixodes persulcatus]
KLLRFPGGKNITAGRRKKAWLAIVKRKDFEPTATSKLCEDHFEESQIETHRADGRKLLKQSAVPTIL